MSKTTPPFTAEPVEARVDMFKTFTSTNSL